MSEEEFDMSQEEMSKTEEQLKDYFTKELEDSDESEDKAKEDHLNKQKSKESKDSNENMNVKAKIRNNEMKQDKEDKSFRKHNEHNTLTELYEYLTKDLYDCLDNPDKTEIGESKSVILKQDSSKKSDDGIKPNEYNDLIQNDSPTNVVKDLPKPYYLNNYEYVNQINLNNQNNEFSEFFPGRFYSNSFKLRKNPIENLINEYNLENKITPNNNFNMNFNNNKELDYLNNEENINNNQQSYQYNNNYNQFANNVLKPRTCFSSHTKRPDLVIFNHNSPFTIEDNQQSIQNNQYLNRQNNFNQQDYYKNYNNLNYENFTPHNFNSKSYKASFVPPFNFPPNSNDSKKVTWNPINDVNNINKISSINNTSKVNNFNYNSDEVNQNNCTKPKINSVDKEFINNNYITNHPFELVNNNLLNLSNVIHSNNNNTNNFKYPSHNPYSSQDLNSNNFQYKRFCFGSQNKQSNSSVSSVFSNSNFPTYNNNNFSVRPPVSNLSNPSVNSFLKNNSSIFNQLNNSTGQGSSYRFCSNNSIQALNNLTNQTTQYTTNVSPNQTYQNVQGLHTKLSSFGLAHNNLKSNTQNFMTRGTNSDSTLFNKSNVRMSSTPNIPNVPTFQNFNLTNPLNNTNKKYMSQVNQIGISGEISNLQNFYSNSYKKIDINPNKEVIRKGSELDVIKEIPVTNLYSSQSNYYVSDKDLIEYKEYLGQDIDYSNLTDKEIIKLAYFLAKEQNGCRFLQKKIDENDDFGEKEILPALLPYLLELINNNFGNYLIQKLIGKLKPQSYKSVLDVVSLIL